MTNEKYILIGTLPFVPYLSYSGRKVKSIFTAPSNKYCTTNKFVNWTTLLDYMGYILHWFCPCIKHPDTPDEPVWQAEFTEKLVNKRSYLAASGKTCVVGTCGESSFFGDNE